MVVEAHPRHREQLRLGYEDGQARASQRIIEPHGLVHAGYRWYLAAWDCGRADFRTFRLDRIDAFQVQPDRFRAEPGKTLHDFLKREQTWTRTRSQVTAADT